MPFVLIRVNEEAETRAESAGLMELLREHIAGVLPGDLDPNDDLDVNIERRHPNAHSKYDMTIDIEAMKTQERAENLGAITKTIHYLAEQLFNHKLKVNVWIKLVEAGYQPA